VVTRIDPVVAPAGTVAWIAVSEVTEKVALAPLNVTAVAPLKPVPLIVTAGPHRPARRSKARDRRRRHHREGAAAGRRAPDVVTRISPVVAPAGHRRLDRPVSEVTEKVALVPLTSRPWLR